ncbi:MAG: hypothetical protein V5B38_17480 [Candidatus Accumulibacter propinquus]|jgi:hypothetical protein
MNPLVDGWTRADAEAVLDRGDAREIRYVPVSVGLEAPACGPEWAENICLALARHADEYVRGNALLGLAHLARTCRAVSSRQAVVEAVTAGLCDQSRYVRGHALDAADDLQIFAGIVLPR